MSRFGYRIGRVLRPLLKRSIRLRPGFANCLSLSLARALVLRLALALVLCFGNSIETLLELLIRSSTLPNQVIALPIAKSQTRNTWEFKKMHFPLCKRTLIATRIPPSL
jgi:hypothetical protein